MPIIWDSTFSYINKPTIIWDSAFSYINKPSVVYQPIEENIKVVQLKLENKRLQTEIEQLKCQIANIKGYR